VLRGNFMIERLADQAAFANERHGQKFTISPHPLFATTAAPMVKAHHGNLSPVTIMSVARGRASP
jgi:hypothetical protein